MEKAGTADARAVALLRRFVVTCSMNDRAANGRKAARLVVGLLDGDDDPTCAEHGLVNIMEEGRKAMDKVLREMMNISDEQAEADAAKIKQGDAHLRRLVLVARLRAHLSGSLILSTTVVRVPVGSQTVGRLE